MRKLDNEIGRLAQRKLDNQSLKIGQPIMEALSYFKLDNQSLGKLDSQFCEALSYNRRGQSSLEFLILVAAVFFFFIGLVFAIQVNLADKTRENTNLEFRETALIVQDEIDLARGASDGFCREFDVPEKIAGQEYIISIKEGLVYLRTSDDRYALALDVGEVNGEIVQGKNVIENDQGKVFLNREGAFCSTE